MPSYTEQSSWSRQSRLDASPPQSTLLLAVALAVLVAEVLVMRLRAAASRAVTPARHRTALPSVAPAARTPQMASLYYALATDSSRIDRFLFQRVPFAFARRADGAF